jgi:hypothetical protein
LRRRTAGGRIAFAPARRRTGAFLCLPASRPRRLRHQSGATPERTASSFVTVSPKLIATSDWTRHEVTAIAARQLHGLRQDAGARPAGFDGKVTGPRRCHAHTALIGEGTLIVGTDNPGSPNVQAGPHALPIYTTLGGTLRLTQRFNRVEVTVKGTAERTEYQESKFTDGTTAATTTATTIASAARAHQLRLMPGLKPFVEVGADTRQHDLEFDRFGLQRDSDGWTVKAARRSTFSRRLTGEHRSAGSSATYEDASLQELNGFLFDASLIYVDRAPSPG